MTCSPERLAANRKNALASTGPRSPEGKARSSRNALKHGLTGEGLALPDEDRIEVEARFAAFERDLRPANDVARFIAHRAALLSVRLERCARQETRSIARAMLRAGDLADDLRRDDLKRSIAALESDPDPADAARRLRRSAEGVDWMIARWEELRADLLRPGHARWPEPHWLLADRLTGRGPGGVRPSRIAALSRAVLGDCGGLEPGEHPGLPPDDRREAARSELAALLDQELAGLRADRAAIDPEAVAADRAAAVTEAIFDPSPGAALARRYEAAAERGFYKALQQIERINAAEASGPDEVSDLEETVSVEVASSGSPSPAGPARFAGPRTGPPPEPVPRPSSERPRPPGALPTWHEAEPPVHEPPIRG